MLSLLIKAKISEDEAKTLISAAEIIVDANASVRGWTEQQTKMRKAFEKAVIASHIIKEQI